jgi:chemotaxis protein MotB
MKEIPKVTPSIANKIAEARSQDSRPRNSLDLFQELVPSVRYSTKGHWKNTSMAEPVSPPVIVIKRKGGHAGAHGGAWKVAYADFVTAMMALFIVLWLLSTTADVQKSVSAYFRDPKGIGNQMGSSMTGNGESLKIVKSNMNLLKGKIEQSMKSSPKLQALKDYVQMTVTGEGLRIELLESDKGMFFESGQPVPTSLGKDLLAKLAPILGEMPNSLVIEGHTDAKPFDSRRYSNWELSIGRANAARNILQKSGLRTAQVLQVRGFADQQLRLPEQPEDASNRRISIIVQYPHVNEPEEPKAKGGKEGEGGEEGAEKASAASHAGAQHSK